MKVEKKQSVRGKKGRYKKFCLIALPILLLSILAGSGIAMAVYHAKYSNYASLAQTGIQHLRTAAALLETLQKNPLDAFTVTQTQHEFAASMTTFVQLDDGLKSLPGISTLVPVYGARLSAALHLTALAIDLSQAGLAGCAILNLLISRFHSSLSTQGHNLTMADFTSMDQEFQQIKWVFNQAIAEANQLQPSDLQFDPRIGKMLATFRQEIPALQVWLDNAEKLLPVLPTLLGVGTPTNYLIEVLDSTELRPAGGFIGNYGIATFSGGRLTAAHITDVVLLDKPYRLSGHSIPYPSAYAWFNRYLADGSWSFRDSDLDADFPTAARYGELNYRREDYYQLGPGAGSSLIPSPDGHSSLRKRFTELLAEHFLARVRQLPASDFSTLVQLMVNSLHSKDLQIYFNSAMAENVLQDLHLNAAIQAPVGDGLFVVDTNVAADKANNFIINTLYDQVTIDAKGNAIHHTTISYAWVIAGHNYGSARYQDYVRVYVPTNSILLVQDEWQSYGTSEAFGREVWAGFFTLYDGQTRAITLTWMVPGAARKDVNGWHYKYEIQRQAGAQRELHLQITLPLCSVMLNKRGGLVVSNKQVATLTQPLNEDMNVGIDYTY